VAGEEIVSRRAIAISSRSNAWAEPLIVSGYKGLKAREAKSPPPPKARLSEAADRIVRLDETWGVTAKAAVWNKELSATAKTNRPETSDWSERAAPAAGNRTRRQD
jgi:hypothetical protein